MRVLTPIPERPPLCIPRWLWNAVMGLLGITALAACGSSSSPPAPPPVNPPFSGAITTAGWSIIQSNNPRPLLNGSFTFQQAPSALNVYDSYVTVPLAVAVANGLTYSVTFAITGDSPVWVNDTSGNTVPPCNSGAPSLSLIIRHANGARWFSALGPFQKTLALGTQTISVPLVEANWINQDGAEFQDTLAHLGAVGFVLGGGCFSGHGVVVSSGSATLQINSATIQ